MVERVAPRPRAGRLADGLAGGLTIMVGLTLAALVLVVAGSVAARDVFGRSILGVEEVTQPLFVLSILLALPLATRPAHAMALDLVPVRPRWARPLARAVADGVVGFVCIGLAIGGVEVVQRIGGTSPMLGLPEAARYGAVPICAGLALVLRGLDAVAGERPWGPALAALAVGGIGCALATAGWLPPMPLSPSLVAAIGFTAALIVGAPLPFVMLFAVLVALPAGSLVPAPGVAHALVTGASSFLLLAIPFFILAGALMASGGLAHRLIGLADALVGHRRAGLAQTSLLTSTLFAGLSGSSIADAGIGAKMLVPQLVARGYAAPYACAVVAATSILPAIIPPSIAFLILASVTDLSVADLWAGGLAAGLVLALTLGLTINRLGGDGARPPARWSERGAALRRALPVLGLAVVVLGGIRSGLVTATEAGVLAVGYAVALGVLVDRAWRPRAFALVIGSAGVDAATVGLLVAAGAPIGQLLTVDQVPATLIELLGPVADHPVLFLIAANILLFLVGLPLDAGPAIVIFAPLLMPLAIACGIDPIHFGVVFVVNLMIGGLSPPVGVLVNVTSTLTGTSSVAVFRAVLPFVAALCAALLLLTFVPALTLVFVPTP